ncbi:hypothetical protein DV451_001509 [Geotrichum candidum]|uniref:isoleucine--tRNA ligase n=1 Tax=Geotrichum candidum TaxID=1173061 RepID=A0A9P5KTM5_GEOCN|nr:hypothetical protein DV451_001509 [Geotrichum candidum]KAF5106368.1 hypothetical protein DV453_004020 [Geotrichum candidum]
MMLKQLAAKRAFASQAGGKDLAHSFAKTLALPKTDFPNRSGSPEAIKKLTARVADDLYSWQTKSDSLKGVSCFHDGPPFANASLHLGHALNKITKDIINRFNLLQGKRINYRPGWDCHGLPIEFKALQILSEKAKKDVATVLSPTEIRTIAKNHALEAIEDQKKSFRRYAVMGDWEGFYATMQTDYEVRQLQIFKEMIHKGFITRKNKPVYWGTQTRTALAEAELEYNDTHRSTSATVKFPVKTIGESLKAVLAKKVPEVSEANLSVLIWTTTPWTLVSNKAVAVNVDMTYTLLHSSEHGYLVVASDLAEKVKAEDWTILDVQFSGADLLNTTYYNPIKSAEHHHPILPATYVTSTVGTGLVHTAPGHGFDDYLLCKSYNIDTYSPVDSEGKYTSDLPDGCTELEGLYVLGAGQKKIIEILQEKQILVNCNPRFRHKYPYDWRSKKPIIIRATPQWFADIDEIKKHAVESLKDVEFYPPQGRTRLETFTQSRSEWCISRQRVWGVPIPAIYHKGTQEPLTDIETMDFIIGKISELGTDAWFVEEENVENWLPEKYKGKGTEYFKGKDTMDVWFDSGTSWTMLEKRPNEPHLADYYLEGSDQHRGWFQSSLLTKIAASKEGEYIAPFKTVITHGFTLDDKGKKMSKSLGNTISPDAVIEGKKGQWPALGVDGLRLWAASSDYTKDVTVGSKSLKNVAENLKKLRITLRFLLGSLNDFDASKFSFQPEKMHTIDLIALHQLKKMTETVKDQYASYGFNRVVQTINYHTNSHLSAFYFDIIKDRLYAAPANSDARRSVQFVLSEILRVYLSILSPITPLLTQEAWDYAHFSKISDSPFKQGWAQLPAEYESAVLEKELPLLENLISIVKQAMEKGRIEKKITSSLTCDVRLQIKEDSEVYKTIIASDRYSSHLAEFFICSQVSVNKASVEGEVLEWKYESTSLDGAVVAEAVPTQHHKCPRCWQYTSVVEDSLCGRCEDTLK